MDAKPHLHMHHYKLSHLRHIFNRLMVQQTRHDVDYRAIYDENTLAVHTVIGTIKSLWSNEDIDRAHRWVVGNIYNSDKGYYSIGRPVGRNVSPPSWSKPHADHSKRATNGHNIMAGLDDDYLSDIQLTD